MKLLTGITNDTFQQHTLTLEDGSQATLTLRYLASPQRWMYDVAHPLLTVSGGILCTDFNVLRQFVNTARWGLACITEDGTDPFLDNDFSTGRAVLYTLSSADLDRIETL